MRLLVFVAIISWSFFGCSKDESLQPVRNSEGLTMDGSHYVPFSGAPDEILQSHPIDSSIAAAWSSTPLSLQDGGFAIGTENGKLCAFNSGDSLQWVSDLGDTHPVTQLLVDSTSIYAILGTNGLCATDHAGHLLWKRKLDTTINGAAILVQGALIIPCVGDLTAISNVNGKSEWTLSTTTEPRSVVYNSAKNYLVAALTSHDFERKDTLYILSLNGKLQQTIPVAGRITSNLALCGEEKNLVAVASASGSGARKTISVQLYDVSNGKLLQQHRVPYFANSIGANKKSYFASGFRNSSSESVSGIDAFSLDDTTPVWSRRFTEPIASPIAVSDGSLYFSLSFESEAIVASKGLFYTLDARNGKTLSERAVAGAVSGFVPGMPMPDDAGRLLLADRARPIVYILNRSALRRMF